MSLIWRPLADCLEKIWFFSPFEHWTLFFCAFPYGLNSSDFIHQKNEAPWFFFSVFECRRIVQNQWCLHGSGDIHPSIIIPPVPDLNTRPKEEVRMSCPGSCSPRNSVLSLGLLPFPSSPNELMSWPMVSDPWNHVNAPKLTTAILEDDSSLECCIEVTCEGSKDNKCRNNVNGNACATGSYVANFRLVIPFILLKAVRYD